MENFTQRVLKVLIIILLPLSTFANVIIVKGIVKYSNGSPAANKTIKISIDSSSSIACFQNRTVVTNPNGFYIDTLRCNYDITKIKVSIENCDGSLLINYSVASPTSNYVESNFVLCTPGTTPPNLSCKPSFKSKIDGWKVYFGDSSTVAAGDSIISRTWRLGDGTVIDGNKINYTHEYKKAGKYEVCLSIKTAKGCENKICRSIEIPELQTICKAAFTFERTASRTFRFSSKNSIASTGDTIQLRKWIFGDGSILEGTEISPLKQYKDTGTYNVCLLIKTKKGCESKICMTVVVKDSITTVPQCQARFSKKIDGQKLYVYANNSSVSAGDSIIKFMWIWGDGSSSETKSPEITHSYTKAGKYQVCLYTKTAKGCESKICETIEIAELPLNCSAYYTYEKINARSFRLSSGRSLPSTGDTIRERIWVFGDGTFMDGNEISPLKSYKDTGSYTVCLKIKTVKGCEAMYCSTIVVKDSTLTNTPPTCKAYFSFAQKEQAIQFNSLQAMVPAGDSIISRTWLFGDSSAPLTGNRKDPSYSYRKPGTYTVCLIIKTSKGCESKYCATVQYQPINTVCSARFSDERIAPKKIRFNSSQSQALQGDSIIERKWKFGDGTELSGNVVSPEKEYKQRGIYTVCLQIKTAAGCKSETCRVFEIKDTSSANEPISQRIKIIKINPNPVTTRLIATIWSKLGVDAEVSVYDIYGTMKWSGKKQFLAGDNFTEVPVLNLKPGPYFLRVRTATGNDSKLFYKF